MTVISLLLKCVVPAAVEENALTRVTEPSTRERTNARGTFIISSRAEVSTTMTSKPKRCAVLVMVEASGSRMVDPP